MNKETKETSKELSIIESFGNVPSKIKFLSDFSFDLQSGIVPVKYIPGKVYGENEVDDFDFINSLYTKSIVGGGGVTAESITFNIGALPKTTTKDSKLDYSKRSIQEYLIKEYSLEGEELNESVNDIYLRLTKKYRGDINKEVTLKDFNSTLNEVIMKDKKLISKLFKYEYNCYMGKHNVNKAINIVMRKHKNYYQYGIDLNDIRQDIFLYYLQRKKSLPLRWIIAKKKYYQKTNRKLTVKKFLTRNFQSYLRKRVNEYLYCFHIPSDLKAKFPEKAKQYQIRSISKKYGLKKLTSPVSRVQLASLNIIGSEAYFNEVKLYKEKTKQYLNIDKSDKILSDIELILKKQVYIDIWNLKLEGLKQKEIAEKLLLSIPLVKKHCMNINKLFDKYNY